MQLTFRKEKENTTQKSLPYLKMLHWEWKNLAFSKSWCSPMGSWVVHFPPHHQHWLLLRERHSGPLFVCVITLMFDYSMHTHTSREAKVQELERLQNTTHGPIHYKTFKILIKGAVLVLLTWLLNSAYMAIHWDNGEGQFILFGSFLHNFCNMRWGALGLFGFLIKSVSQGPRGCVLSSRKEKMMLS